jgi:hypothetical protein
LTPRWHHVKCFVEKRADLEYFASGEDLAGFHTLSPDDKVMLRAELKATKAPKRKTEDPKDVPDAKKSKQDEEALKKQNKKMFYYRDLLEKALTKAELQDLLEANDQVPIY